ncbi:MAG: hypothetical protein ACT4P5_08665 [Armatimonadota bacterium]
MLSGVALVEFDEGRRDRDQSVLQSKIDKIGHLPNSKAGKGWPQGASIGTIREVRRIMGGKHAPKFNVFVDVTANNEDDLKTIFGFIEEHCHVEGYA